MERAGGVRSAAFLGLALLGFSASTERASR